LCEIAITAARILSLIYEYAAPTLHLKALGEHAMPSIGFTATVLHGFAILLCLSFFACSPSSAEDADLPSVKMLSCESACGTWTKPVPIDHGGSFPGNEPDPEQPEAEAYVVIRLTVTAEGKVADPVVEQLIGPEVFGQHALKDVRRWRYQPATLNGVAVQRPNEVATLIYRFDPRDLVARDSIGDTYRRARVQFLDQKYDDAKAGLLKTVTLERLNFYERAMTSFFLAMVEFNQSNYAVAYNHIDIALLDNGEFLDLRSRETALRLAIRIGAAAGQFATALDAFAKLKKIADIGENDSDAKLISNVTARLNDASPIPVFGAIPSEGISGPWQHILLRRNFVFDLLNGNLDHLELRCDQQEISSPISETAEWHVPKSWSGCDLDVFGSPGATFRVIETND
jgi:TonB family protein